MVIDRKSGKAVSANKKGVKPHLAGSTTLKGKRKAVPAFELLAKKYDDEAYSPEAVEAVTGCLHRRRDALLPKSPTLPSTVKS
ncbi:MAG: hypothetical protein R3D29_15805 [Nitratireductor sp.]